MIVVTLKNFYDFCQIYHCCFAQPYSFLGLFVGVVVIGDENHEENVVGHRNDIFTN